MSNPLVDVLAGARASLAEAPVEDADIDAAEALILRYLNEVPNLKMGFDDLKDASMGRAILAVPESERRAVLALVLAMMRVRRFEDMAAPFKNALSVGAMCLLREPLAVDHADVQATVDQLVAAFDPFEAGWAPMQIGHTAIIEALLEGLRASEKRHGALPESARARIGALHALVTDLPVPKRKPLKDALAALHEVAEPAQGPAAPIKPKRKKPSRKPSQPASAPGLEWDGVQGRGLALEGNRRTWWAMWTDDQRAATEAVGLTDLRTISWPDAFGAHFQASGEFAILPPVDGWVFALGWMGLSFAGPGEMEMAKRRLAALSQRFGSAYGFSIMSTAHAWLLARDGAITRAYAVSPMDSFFLDEGERAEAEPADGATDGTTVLAVARSLSVTPVDLEDRPPVHGTVVAGRLPTDHGTGRATPG